MSLDNLAEEKILPEEILFSESQGRFIVEVEKNREAEFERRMKGKPYYFLGRVSGEGRIKVLFDGRPLVDVSCCDAEKAWRSGLTW